MFQNRGHNRSIVLAERPKGAPVVKNFRLEKTLVPEPIKGQMLLPQALLEQP